MLESAFFGFTLTNLKHDLAWLWGVITHASFWQLASLALACIAVVQHFAIADARHDRDAYRSQRDGYKAQLDAISTKKNEQKAVTAERIKVVTRTIRDADERAKVVETAPPAPGCKTNAQVMGADL
jgi:hypothetical protein